MVYIHAGNFYRLSPAGQPSGERRLDVPLKFESSSPGLIVYNLPQKPGRLSANSLVRKSGADFQAPMYPAPCVRFVVFFSSTISDVPSRMSDPGVRTSSRHAEEEGDDLETKYPAHGGDAQPDSTSIEYVERYRESRVTFSRPAGHGDDTKPVLITSVSTTQGYAAMTYSNNGTNPRSGFTTPAPMIGSASTPVWGAPHAGGVAYTNYSPQLYYPPSATQNVIILPSYPTPYPQTHGHYITTPALLIPPHACVRDRNACISSCTYCHRSM